jgi:RNA polymerase sigma-70 factor (ECF subfamily)
MKVDMTDSTRQTARIEKCIAQLQQGDEFARGELLNLACDRLTRLTRSILRDFPGVARWEQTDDVFQNASLRLYQALNDVELTDPRHFFRLAALQIRRELIDLARHYQGPQGMGAKHQTQFVDSGNDAAPVSHEPSEATHDPSRVAEWQEFHSRVEQLPDQEREVFDLLWYHELPQEQVASMLDVSVRTVRRRWRSARLMLHNVLTGKTVDLLEEH